MSFAVIGVNHKNCPVEVRDRVTFTHSKVLEGLNSLKAQGVKEVIILSTCNRSEIYIEDEQIEEAIQKIIAFYEESFKQNDGKGSLIPYLFVHQDRAAIQHLFEVAVGLDSIVLGEDQILGQVKKAYNDAVEQGTSGKVTHKIFQEAVSLAKKIKSKIKISEHPLSISHIAIKFLKERQGTLEGKKALIIGLGQMSELTIKYLLEEQLDTIYVTNRTHGKALEMKKAYEGITPVRYGERYNYIKEVDFVISATASPHTILCYEEMPKLHKRVDIMDIAMPRDVDTRINELEHAHVYHIDDLKRISEENSAIREALSTKAQAMIQEAMEKLMKWIEQLSVQEVIQDLDAYCEGVKYNTKKFLRRKISVEIDDETLELIMAETLKRCVRTPIAKVMTTEEKEQREAYAKVLSELFDLN